jgi:hypothetical protein
MERSCAGGGIVLVHSGTPAHSTSFQQEQTAPRVKATLTLVLMAGWPKTTFKKLVHDSMYVLKIKNFLQYISKTRRVHFAYGHLAYVSFSYKIGKLTHRQNDTKICCILPRGKLPMCHLAYEISVGKMQHFPGNNMCILPTGSRPMRPIT